MKKPELLSPAGTLKCMQYAFAFGADAVYAGQPRYSLRARNNDFSLEILTVGIREAHDNGKKFYVTSNILPHNAKVKTYLRDLAPVIDLNPDALIIADPGIIMLVRERWPHIPIHLSVQANTVNYAAVQFWQSLGITRIILSRELSLQEIAEIRQQCPDIELEVFIHGALCIAHSGRCLLSGYFNHRDANQGVCSNACRWQYQLNNASQDTNGDILVASQEQSGVNPAAKGPYLMQEYSRPQTLLPIFEDEHGTYIMNSKDLRAIQYVADLVKIGIDSLKIEGRTKSFYYVARTARAYRLAIDEASIGVPFRQALMEELEKLSNRGYTDGFYRRHQAGDTQNLDSGSSSCTQQRFVGEIIGHDAITGMTEVLVKNKFTVGDILEIITPNGISALTLDAMWDKDGRPLNEAPGGGYQVYISIPIPNVNMGLIARNMV